MVQNIPRSPPVASVKGSPFVKEVIKRLASIGIRVAEHMVTRELTSPRGVEFNYGDILGLRMAANSSEKLVLDNLATDSRDTWAIDGIHILTGYSECTPFSNTVVPNPLHIDFSSNKPTMIRTYFLSPSQYSSKSLTRRAKIENADRSGVYAKIAARMAWKTPAFDLDEHVAEIIRIGPNTLEGIDFVPRDATKLQKALQSMKKGGRNRFAWPHKDTIASNATDLTTSKGVTDNTIFDVSLGATEGAGYREILDHASPSPASAAVPAIGETEFSRMLASDTAKFSGKFTDYLARPDISALHCAVSASKVNIHIDETAVCVYDEQGRMMVSGGAGQHTSDELIWKTYGPKLLDVIFSKAPVLQYLPMKRLPEVLDLRVPNPADGFKNFSAEAFLARKKNVVVSLKYTCAPAFLEKVTGQDYFRKIPGVDPVQKETEHSITFNIMGTHDIGGGRR